jgi:hypothetical protein
MTWTNAEKGPISWLRRWPSIAALVLLAAAGWVLVALAQSGRFAWWPTALILLTPALVAGAVALWQATWFDRLTVLVLIIVAAVLYTPPSQHIALSGDAAIYPNEAAFIARTGGVSAIYEPFTGLSPAARDLFYIGSDEQFDGKFSVQAYEGLLYGGYYVTDAEQARIHTSRMPLTEVWAAWLTALFGLDAAFFLNAIAAVLALVLLYAIGVQISGRGLALWSALLLAVSYPAGAFQPRPLCGDCRAGVDVSRSVAGRALAAPTSGMASGAGAPLLGDNLVGARRWAVAVGCCQSAAGGGRA